MIKLNSIGEKEFRRLVDEKGMHPSDAVRPARFYQLEYEARAVNTLEGLQHVLADVLRELRGE